MTSHELARKLLAWPDLEILAVTGQGTASPTVHDFLVSQSGHQLDSFGEDVVSPPGQEWWRDYEADPEEEVPATPAILIFVDE